MNLTTCRYSKCFVTLLGTAAFFISSQVPLFASPQQASSQPANSAQSNQPAAPEPKPTDSLPDAPQAQPAQAPANQQPAATPSGAAGAKAANSKGSPVAQPAGAAVAPPRQRGHHSLLLKVGLIAAGAVAVGTVVGLSERSSSRPPGAPAATRP